LLLPRYYGADVPKSFEVYETVNTIFSRKAGYFSFSMLTNSRHQIVRNSRIQYVRAAGENVDVIVLFHAYTVKAGPSASLGMTIFRSCLKI